MKGYSLIYITAKNQLEAKEIGIIAVKERLAACANVIPNMSAIYWWHDKIETDEEAVLILKTKKELVKRLIAKVKEIHSYTCPCVVSLDIESGNKDFLKWISKETIK